MISDKDLQCSNAQAALDCDAAVPSTSYVNLSVARDIGAGQTLRPFVKCAEAYKATEVDGVNIKVQLGTAVDGDGVPTFADAVTVSETTALVANLTLNKPVPMPPIKAGVAGKFLRFLYTLDMATGVEVDATAGKFTSGIALDTTQNTVVTY